MSKSQMKRINVMKGRPMNTPLTPEEMSAIVTKDAVDQINAIKQALASPDARAVFGAMGVTPEELTECANDTLEIVQRRTNR